MSGVPLYWRGWWRRARVLQSVNFWWFSIDFRESDDGDTDVFI